VDRDELPSVDELQWAKDIFTEMGDAVNELLFTKFSNKSRVVLNIVKEAVRLRENILIFVHSIPTLEYLLSKLNHKKYKTYVLTGQTQMKERQVEIDRFNRDTGAVYLISCRVWRLIVADNRREVSGSILPRRTV
jgi:SNF2 family DNA or RNA helicase